MSLPLLLKIFENRPDNNCRGILPQGVNIMYLVYFYYVYGMNLLYFYSVYCMRCRYLLDQRCPNTTRIAST